MSASFTSGELSSIFKLLRVWDEQFIPEDENIPHRYSFSFTPRVKVDAPSSGGQEHLIEGMSCLQPFLLHPSSLKRLAWDLVSMVFLAYDIIMIPFFEAFDPEPVSFTTVMNYVIMLFWTLDMVASMITGYQEGKDTVIEPKRIIKRYLTTWFWLDIVIVSLDWSLFALNRSNPGRSNAARLGRSLRTLRFARTLRLIRLLKAKRILLEIQDQINTEALSITFRILKIVLILMLANHVVACSWYYIGQLGTGNEDGMLSSWIVQNEMSNKPLAYRYVTSLHWSLTQFTPASMEVVPENTGERVFAVVVLVLAMITFSSFVSILTASMAELRNLGNDETRQFWLLRRYLRDWQVSRRFTLRLQRYLEYAYHKQRQRVQAKDVKLLALLSGPLHDELKAETLSVHLVTHPLFRSANRSLHVFSRSLSDMYLCRADCAFTYGERGSSMLFVYTGVFDYQPGENSLARQQHVGEGRWVAEAVLWTHWLHLGDFEAVTDGQVISIDAHGFGEAVLVFQPSWLAFRVYAQRFVEAMNRLDRNSLSDLLHVLLPPQDIVDSSGFEKNQSMHPMDEDREPALIKFSRALWSWLELPRTWFHARKDRSRRGKDEVEKQPSFDGLSSTNELRSLSDSERLP